MSMVRFNKSMLIDDYFDKIQLLHSGDEQTGYHYIKIDDLQQGEYKLEFLTGHEWQHFEVNVHKG